MDPTPCQHHSGPPLSDPRILWDRYSACSPSPVNELSNNRTAEVQNDTSSVCLEQPLFHRTFRKHPDLSASSRPPQPSRHSSDRWNFGLGRIVQDVPPHHR